MDKLIIVIFTFLFALKLTHTWDVSWWVIVSPLVGLFVNTYEIIKVKKDL